LRERRTLRAFEVAPVLDRFLDPGASSGMNREARNAESNQLKAYVIKER
jgi:hypothetical protein